LLVKKAVITAAARSQRTLPLQTLIDVEGNKKSLLCILIDQSLGAGAEEIAVVVWPGDESSYAQAAGPHGASVHFIPQTESRGYGHALHCASSFTKGDPFLHMVGDHLYINTTRVPSAQRLVELAEKEHCSVSGVQPTRESLLQYYGTIGGRRVPPRSDLYRVEVVVEKPTPTEAEQRLLITGIRAGYYLCFFGIHVFTPTVMDIALTELARQEQYLAVEDEGRRYDLGSPYGLLIAQFALALNGRDRSEVLSQLLELLADRELAGNGGGIAS
jgi:UTP--glucose-1-phosphate uridylyltransferase